MTVSKHPVPPQAQRAPPGSMLTWPNSPAPPPAAAEELAIDEDGGADAFGKLDDDEDGGVAVRAEPFLGEGQRPGIVLDGRRDAEAVLEEAGDRDVLPPSEVAVFGREPRVAVDKARSGDADAPDGAASDAGEEPEGPFEARVQSG
ncbi:MAG: hypothetical protein V2A58_02565 [Planctomycetota bacterium]